MPADQKVIRLLLVEDNPADAFLLKTSLTKARDVNFELTIVQRLKDAIAVLEENSVDAVVTDLNLPDSLGVETVKQLVKIAGGLPIIALTGWDDPVLGARLIDEGARCYWSKDRIIDIDLPNAIAQTINSVT
jgi:phosphoserine phosphatase RsbU/P